MNAVDFFKEAAMHDEEKSLFSLQQACLHSNLPILLGYRFSFSFCYVLLRHNLYFSFVHLQYFNNTKKGQQDFSFKYSFIFSTCSIEWWNREVKNQQQCTDLLKASKLLSFHFTWMKYSIPADAENRCRMAAVSMRSCLNKLLCSSVRCVDKALL